jgi:outer membrane protein OmpA-like peptidoglycan-associated protein
MKRFLMVMGAVLAFTVPAVAQEKAPRADVAVGYSYLRDTTNEGDFHGGSGSLAFNFTRRWGLVADFGGYKLAGDQPGDLTVYSYLFGPRLSLRGKHLTLFGQVLLGGARASFGNNSQNSFALSAGPGLDWNIGNHFAIRLFQAEYLMTRFGTGTNNHENNMRVSAGFVFRFGSIGPPPVPASAACSADPAEVFAGEPVTATATGSDFHPKRTIRYSWSGVGVRVGGTDASTQIDTTGLEPGAYQVSANLNDGSKTGVASCIARFVVKQPRPPTISCSADPGTVQPGGTATIRSTASSPDNRTLSYSYNASAGSISGTDVSATLNTAGVPPGSITVTCNVSDDRNPPLTASAATTVIVEAPPPPVEQKQLESRLALHSIYFQTARPTEANPSGGLVDSQQETLTTLANDFKSYLTFKPDAHLTLSGHADRRGSSEYNKALTERRVERAKSFLVEHGVPADSIETRALGKEDNLSAEQVKELIEQNPDLTAEERAKILKNLPVIVLANNRRVDVTLSTTGQESVRQYPFNAKDAYNLISPKGGEKEKRTAPPAKRRVRTRKP